MPNIDAKKIEELRSLLAKATLGPWSTHLVDDTTIMSPARQAATTCDSSQTNREDVYDIEYEQMEADAALIVAMRNALPDLLDELASLSLRVEAEKRVGADDSKTRAAIGERFCLVPPDGGDVKTWEAAAEMRKALEAAETALAAEKRAREEAERERDDAIAANTKGYGLFRKERRAREAAETHSAALARALPDDLRADGWAVAVHNDYRLHGEPHTFWLFTKGDRAIKGEGKNDAEALDAARRALSPGPKEDTANG